MAKHKQQKSKSKRFIWEGFQPGDVLVVLRDGTIEGYRPGPGEGAPWTRYPLGRGGGKATKVSEEQALHAIVLGTHGAPPARGAAPAHHAQAAAHGPGPAFAAGTRIEGLQTGYAVVCPQDGVAGRHHRREHADRTLRRERRDGHAASLWSVEKGKLKEKLA